MANEQTTDWQVSIYLAEQPVTDPDEVARILRSVWPDIEIAEDEIEEIDPAWGLWLVPLPDPRHSQADSWSTLDGIYIRTWIENVGEVVIEGELP